VYRATARHRDPQPARTRIRTRVPRTQVPAGTIRRDHIPYYPLIGRARTRAGYSINFQSVTT
jgi:hypothetical protein